MKIDDINFNALEEQFRNIIQCTATARRLKEKGGEISRREAARILRSIGNEACSIGLPLRAIQE